MQLLFITNCTNNFLFSKINYSDCDKCLIDRLLLIQILKDMKEFCRTCYKSTPRGLTSLYMSSRSVSPVTEVPVGRSGQVFIGSQGVAPWPCGTSWPPGKGTPAVDVNKNFSTISESGWANLKLVLTRLTTYFLKISLSWNNIYLFIY